MGRQVGDELLNYVLETEGFRPYWYDDTNYRRLSGPDDRSARGTPTIGHGLTGREWDKQTITVRQSAEKVRELLSGRYRDSYDKFLREIGWDVPEEARWPMISFGYNLGPQWMNSSGFETMIRAHKAKDQKAVQAAFVLYRNPGSIWEVGLRKRREKEARMWAAGWARIDPYKYLKSKEAKRIKELVQIRKVSAANGWTPARTARAGSIKTYLRAVVRLIKVMPKQQQARGNRRERMALCRDAIAGRPIKL